MKKTIVLLGLLVPYLLNAKQAVVVVPVADLVGQQYNHRKSPAALYQDLSVCGRQGVYACPRVHQLLYNEMVTIIEDKGEELVVKIPHAFFETHNSSTPQNTYWLLKKNVMPLATLTRHGIDLTGIPAPLTYNQKKNSVPQQHLVTLMLPFVDTKAGHTFSAGTRFVIATDQQQENDETIPVYVIDRQPLQQRIVQLPKTICFLQPETKEQQLAQFVILLKKWAQQQDGFIPYVWGGCSFINHCYDEAFSWHAVHDGTAFARADSQAPHTGFDCAGLVLRAAQACGIPYFLKNTTTIAKTLAPLQPGQHLVAGDLIWIPGHVMVVADTRHHTVIEARHYSHGYGKIHMLPLRTVFHGVKTMHQLENMFFNNKKLRRLDKDGTVVQTIPSFKLLRMASVWEQ